MSPGPDSLNSIFSGVDLPPVAPRFHSWLPLPNKVESHWFSGVFVPTCVSEESKQPWNDREEECKCVKQCSPFGSSWDGVFSCVKVLPVAKGDPLVICSWLRVCRCASSTLRQPTGVDWWVFNVCFYDRRKKDSIMCTFQAYKPV